MSREIEVEAGEIARKAEGILASHPAAIYLPCFYRSEPPRIFLQEDAVRVLVKGSCVLDFSAQPYDLLAAGYREIESGRYHLAYEFPPGRRFELDLEGRLLEKRLAGHERLEEVRALREHLGIYDVIPLLEMRRLPDYTGRETILRIKKLDPGITPPSYAHPGDAGLDIRSAEDALLQPGDRMTVSTGFAMALPEGYAAFLQPRSGLASKSGISIVNAPGLIDCHYRGEVKVILINLGREPFQVRRGDRIAQMVVQAVEPVRVKVVEELDPTARGEGGFGSTGL